MSDPFYEVAKKYHEDLMSIKPGIAMATMCARTVDGEQYRVIVTEYKRCPYIAIKKIKARLREFGMAEDEIEEVMADD